MNVTAETVREGTQLVSVVQVRAVPNAGYLFSNWSGDATGTSNPVSVTMNGNKTVTANFNATTLPLTPSGTVSNWDGSFHWTGLADATWYLLEVYTADDTQVLYQWYTSAQSGCAGGTERGVTPAGLNLANGDYKWAPPGLR